jgi:hypothetical protein
MRLLLLSLPRLLELCCHGVPGDSTAAAASALGLAKQIETAFAQDRARRGGKPRVLALQRLECSALDPSYFDGLEAPALASLTLHAVAGQSMSFAAGEVKSALKTLPLLRELRLPVGSTTFHQEVQTTEALFRVCAQSQHRHLRSIVLVGAGDSLFRVDTARLHRLGLAQGLPALSTIVVERWYDDRLVQRREFFVERPKKCISKIVPAPMR